MTRTRTSPRVGRSKRQIHHQVSTCTDVVADLSASPTSFYWDLPYQKGPKYVKTLLCPKQVLSQAPFVLLPSSTFWPTLPASGSTVVCGDLNPSKIFTSHSGFQYQFPTFTKVKHRAIESAFSVCKSIHSRGLQTTSLYPKTVVSFHLRSSLQ